MKEYNPKTIKEALIFLDEQLSDANKNLLQSMWEEDISYPDSTKGHLIAAEISNNWLDIKKCKLFEDIPNFDEIYKLEYGYAILKIYKRYLLKEELYSRETLLKVNYMECPKDILRDFKY